MSERYLGTHRPAPVAKTGAVVRFRTLLLVTVAALAGMLIGGTTAFAIAAGDQVVCQPGEGLLAKPDGTWSCVPLQGPTPSPSATVSPSPSPSASATTPPPSPSASPTASPSPTPTPSPSPTPTGPPSLLRNCFGDVKNSAGVIDQARLAACGYPTLASTGVPAAITPTPYTGPLTITAANTVIDGKAVNGCLDIRTTGVTIRNSRITCAGGGWAGVYADDAPTAANLRIDHVEITCVDGHRHGVWVHGATITNAYIHDCENAGEVNGNTVIRDSYLVAREVGAGHADDLQSQGGNDVVIDHNVFAGLNPITSSIITNPTQNLRWTITRNFLSAGAFVLYCAESGSGAWVVSDNRFYAPVGNWQSDPHRPAYGFTDGCGGVGTWLNNYRDNDLQPVGR